MLLSEQEYAHAAGILAGRIDREALLREFDGWFGDAFGMKVYDYICGFTNAGRVRLKVVLWDNECRKRMMKGTNPDFRKQERVGQKFSELCRKYRVHPAYYRAEDILVCYDTLQDELRKRILKQESARIKAVKGQDICRVEIIFDSVHIFFGTDAQAECHLCDGVCEAVNRQISGIIKEHDSFGVFPEGIQCVFTSLQTLREKYEGNMFYYTR